jgi:hypothetical protein
MSALRQLDGEFWIRVEHVTFNHGVEGSSPSALTTLKFVSLFINLRVASIDLKKAR